MKRRHELIHEHGEYFCSVCRWSWQSRPYSRCPGLRRFTWADAELVGLATKTTLGREGLKPAEGQEPVGAVLSGDNRHYWRLYRRGDAVPKAEMSPAQAEAALANLEKARAALTCRRCGQRFATKWALDPDGYCERCSLLVMIQEAKLDAEEELWDLASDPQCVVVDFETTGLDGAAEILQIGVVGNDGAVLMDRLVRPAGGIGAQWVHGISEEDVAGAPGFAEVYQELAGLLAGKFVLSYNAAFDGPMLDQTCARYLLAEVAVKDWTCVMRLFARWLGWWDSRRRDFRWVKLADALERRGIVPEPGALHSAAGDARLTWRLLQTFK